MYNIEKKALGWIEQHLNILYLIIITLLAFAIRLVGFSFLSGDMTRFLIPWFYKIQEQGLSSRVGDYNLLYQTLIYAMTFIPLPIVWQYKLLSVFFDFALAVVCGKFCCELRGKEKNDSCFLFVYTAVLFLPTVFLNSGFWGQCDSIYVFFVILSMYLLYVERTTISFVMLGIAFAFKLQSIFIVPFYLYYYFNKKSFSLLSFLIVPGVLLLSGFFCYVQGQSILSPIQIYFHQTKEYSALYQNIHSFFTVFQQNDQILVQCLVSLGLILTVSIFGSGLYAVMRKKMDLRAPKTFIAIAAWCAWVCILFLPKMHERYTYLLDILLLLLITLDRKFIPFAFISESLSLITYANYLGGVDVGVESKFLWLLYIGAFIRFSMIFVEGKSLTSKELFKAFRKQSVFFYVLLALCAVGAISLVIIPQVRELIIRLAEKGIGRPLTHEVWHKSLIMYGIVFLDIALLFLFFIVNIRRKDTMETKGESF